MKKLLFAIVSIVTLGFGALTIFADSPDTNNIGTEYETIPRNGMHHNYRGSDELSSREFEEQKEYRNERIDEAVEDGRISEEEAAEWKKEIEEMDSFDDSDRFHHGRSHRRNSRHRRGMRRNSSNRSYYGCH